MTRHARAGSYSVTPAQAGVHTYSETWVPASAGTMDKEGLPDGQARCGLRDGSRSCDPLELGHVQVVVESVLCQK